MDGVGMRKRSKNSDRIMTTITTAKTIASSHSRVALFVGPSSPPLRFFLSAARLRLFARSDEERGTSWCRVVNEERYRSARI